MPNTAVSMRLGPLAKIMLRPFTPFSAAQRSASDFEPAQTTTWPRIVGTGSGSVVSAARACACASSAAASASIASSAKKSSDSTAGGVSTAAGDD